MKKISALLLILLLAISVDAKKNDQKNEWILSSPNKNIEVKIYLQNSEHTTGKLFYEVFSTNKRSQTTVIEQSRLGLERENETFVEGLSFVSQSKQKTIDENYRMLIGKQLQCRNFCREMTLTLQNKFKSKIDITFRAYNNGIAFRYSFPEKSEKSHTIIREFTSFNLNESGKAWIQPYDKPSQWTPGYEKYYENNINIGTSSPNTEGWAFPALFQTVGHWALISESDLRENYCGVRLEQCAPKGNYTVRFPEEKDGEGTGLVQPSSSTPWIMPWRSITIGTSLSDIFESNMINDLAQPQISLDFSWVKPGRSSWSWLTDNDSPKNFETLKQYIDLSAEMHWEYCLVDANWDLMSGGNIEQIVEYANKKSVGILMWYNSGGSHNTVSERPRDIISDSIRCEEEFLKLHKMGVKGVKIDFWQSDKQNLISLYHKVLKCAARNHLLVNLHGCTIPRGWSRTYPNLISHEAVKGEEAYLFDSTYPNNAPIQNTVLPFTRNVIGPMDYTPVVFSNLKNPHKTTYAHELALSLIFNSGITHFAGNIRDYSNLPSDVKQFLQEVPTAFDETRLLSAEIGESIVIACRKATVWYIAGINSSQNARDLTFDLQKLSFTTRTLNVITDNTDGTGFSTAKIFKNGKFSVSVKPYGGFISQINIR